MKNVNYGQLGYRRKYLRYASAFVLGVMIAAAIVLAAFAAGANSPSKDSGVSACQTLADNTSKPAAEKKLVGLKDFQESKIAELKVAGVDFVTTVKSNKESDGLGGAVADLTKLHTQYAALQVACAKQGVNLPPLPS